MSKQEEFVRSLVQQKIRGYDAFEIVEEHIGSVAARIPELREPAADHECGDENCPHTSVISPLAMFFFAESIKDCIRIKPGYFSTFNPSKYPITEMDDIPSVYMQDQDALYNRFSIRRKKEYWNELYHGYKIPRGFFNILEGFVFNPEDKVIGISLHFNDLSREFVIVDNKFLPVSFLLPITLMPYTEVFIRIKTETTRDAKVDFRMICGNFLYLNTLKSKKGEQWRCEFEHSGTKCTLLVCNDCGWMSTD